MKPTKNDITMSIGEVAKLLNISPGMLRTWENEGLVAPDRSQGAHRVYSNRDLQRLRKVAKLYLEEKLNPAAIRRELGPIAPSPARQNPVDARLGEKLRQIRGARGMTLIETSKKSGLSPSFISALERGNTGVSIEALFRLAEALGTTLLTLNSDSVANITAPPAQRHFVPANRRKKFVTEDRTLVIEDIIAKPSGMEAQISTIAPGTDSNGVFSHKGQEFVHVLEGSLSLWLEPEEFYLLKPGDTLYFHSHLKHYWKNESDKPTRVLWVNVALPKQSESSEPAEFELVAKIAS